MMQTSGERDNARDAGDESSSSLFFSLSDEEEDGEVIRALLHTLDQLALLVTLIIYRVTLPCFPCKRERKFNILFPTLSRDTKSAIHFSFQANDVCILLHLVKQRLS